MPSMHISVSDDLKAFVEEQGASGNYTSSSDFIRHVLREERRRIEHRQRIEEKKQAFIAMAREGMESPISDLTPEELRAEAHALIDELYT